MIAYTTPIGTIGNGNSATSSNNMYAHLHHEISDDKTIEQMKDYVIGKGRNHVAENYIDPIEYGIDYDLMFGRNMDPDVKGYDYLDKISGYANSYHTGQDVNGATVSGNGDFGWQFTTPVSGTVVHEYRTWGFNRGWGNLIVIEEDEILPTGANTDPSVYPYKVADFSHWQGKKVGKTIDWDLVPNLDAIIIKATQGQTHVDTDFKAWQKKMREQGRKSGYYHFANGEDYKKEADHFLKTVGKLQQGEFLALDWEHSFENFDAVEWCKNFLDYIWDKSGAKPIIYMGNQQAEDFAWNKVSDVYDLWIARYPMEDGSFYEDDKYKPSIGSWDDWIIWQYTSTATLPGVDTLVDLNVAKSIPVGYVKQTSDDAANLAACNDVVKDQQTLIDHQKAEINSYRQTVQNKDQTIAQLEDMVEDRDTIISDVKEDLSECQDKISEAKSWWDRFWGN